MSPERAKEIVFEFFRLLSTGDVAAAFALVPASPWKDRTPEETRDLSLRMLWKEMAPYLEPLADRRFEGPWLRSITPPADMPEDALGLQLDGPIEITLCFLGKPTDFTAQFSEAAGGDSLELDMIRVM